MSGDLSSRVERRFLLIEERLRKSGGVGDTTIARSDEPVSYVDDKIKKYRTAMEQALINAPCGGCRTLALSGLTSVEIFYEMSRSGRQRADFSDEQIEIIKDRVKNRYKKYFET